MRPLRTVLLIEDSYADARLAQLRPPHSGHTDRLRFEQVVTAAEAKARLKRGGYDIVVCDLTLPDGAGVSLLRRVCGWAGRTPVIALSIIDDERLAISCIEAGADDFVCKRDCVSEAALPKAIARSLRRHAGGRGRGAGRLEPGSTDHARSHFASIISHELRTPLGAIANYAQCLREEVYGPITMRQQTGVEGIASCARHLRLLVDDLLDLSRLDSGGVEIHRRSVDVQALCREALETARATLGRPDVEMGIDVQEALPMLESDANKIRQVLLNLLINALKFTTTGSVMLRASSPPTSSTISFVVEDTGCGIPEAELRRVFEPFYQVHAVGPEDEPVGSGLGLCISERLTHLLGGRLTVRSVVGQGSRFVLELPARSQLMRVPEAV